MTDSRDNRPSCAQGDDMECGVDPGTGPHIHHGQSIRLLKGSLEKREDSSGYYTTFTKPDVKRITVAHAPSEYINLTIENGDFTAGLQLPKRAALELAATLTEKAAQARD